MAARGGTGAGSGVPPKRPARRASCEDCALSADAPAAPEAEVAEAAAVGEEAGDEARGSRAKDETVGRRGRWSLPGPVEDIDHAESRPICRKKVSVGSRKGGLAEGQDKGGGVGSYHDEFESKEMVWRNKSIFTAYSQS